jgi:hypothetical protein
MQNYLERPEAVVRAGCVPPAGGDAVEAGSVDGHHPADVV